MSRAVTDPPISDPEKPNGCENNGGHQLVLVDVYDYGSVDNPDIRTRCRCTLCDYEIELHAKLDNPSQKEHLRVLNKGNENSSVSEMYLRPVVERSGTHHVPVQLMFRYVDERTPHAQTTLIFQV